MSILPVLLQKHTLETDMKKKKKNYQNKQEITKKEKAEESHQEKQDIADIKQNIDKHKNIEKLTSILPALLQKHTLETDIEAKAVSKRIIENKQGNC